MRKAQDDARARAKAEHDFGDAMESAGIIDSSAHEPVEQGHRLLDEVAVAVEFERGIGRTPDGQKIAQRRIVVTGEWQVDPDATPVP